MEEVLDISDEETLHNGHDSASEMEESDDSSNTEPKEETSCNISTQSVNLCRKHDSGIEAF